MYKWFLYSEKYPWPVLLCAIFTGIALLADCLCYVFCYLSLLTAFRNHMFRNDRIENAHLKCGKLGLSTVK